MFHLLGTCQVTFQHTCAFSRSQGLCEASKLSTPWTTPATVRLLGPAPLANPGGRKWIPE